MTFANAVSKVRKLRAHSTDALWAKHPIEAEAYWEGARRLMRAHFIAERDITEAAHREAARANWRAFVGMPTAD